MSLKRFQISYQFDAGFFVSFLLRDIVVLLVNFLGRMSIMTTTLGLIKEWQQALQNEILHLKKFGSNKFIVKNGRLLSYEGNAAYYFETAVSIKIPIGSSIRLDWGSMNHKGPYFTIRGSCLNS